MINPMPKVQEPTKTEQAQRVIVKTVKTISRERELLIAVVFLALGFLMGKF